MRRGDGKTLGLLEHHVAHPAQPHLESLVHADLRKAEYDEVRRVTCTLHQEVLTLRGHVSSYYLKQIAQRIALDRVAGRATVVNELQVNS